MISTQYSVYTAISSHRHLPRSSGRNPEQAVAEKPRTPDNSMAISPLSAYVQGVLSMGV